MNRFLLIAGMLLGICAVLRAVELPPGSVLESNGILKIGNVTLSQFLECSGKCPVAEPQE